MQQGDEKIFLINEKTYITRYDYMDKTNPNCMWNKYVILSEPYYSWRKKYIFSYVEEQYENPSNVRVTVHLHYNIVIAERTIDETIGLLEHFYKDFGRAEDMVMIDF
jgi:hypothetical protein